MQIRFWDMYTAVLNFSTAAACMARAGAVAAVGIGRERWQLAAARFRILILNYVARKLWRRRRTSRPKPPAEALMTPDNNDNNNGTTSTIITRSDVAAVQRKAMPRGMGC